MLGYLIRLHRLPVSPLSLPLSLLHSRGMSIVIRVWGSSGGLRRVTVAPTATLNDVHAALVKDLQTEISVKPDQVSLFVDEKCTAPFTDMSVTLPTLGLEEGSMIFAKFPPVPFHVQPGS